MADNTQSPSDSTRSNPVNTYRGHPSKQRDARAVNSWRAPAPKRQGQPTKPSPKTAPAELPGPTRKKETSSVDIKTTRPSEVSLFQTGMSAREVAPRLTFSPSLPAAIEVSRATYEQYSTDDTNFQKTMLPEYLDYYMTACIWMRLVSLKKKNGEILTSEEQLLFEDSQVSSFNLPEPILRQVQLVGNIVSTTGQHIYVSAPSLPTSILGGFGGYYGDLLPPGQAGADNTLHNLYEEIPCLGVLAEAIRNSVGNGAPGPYNSNVSLRR